MLMHTESTSPASSAWIAARPPPSIWVSSTCRPYLRSSPSSGTSQTRMLDPATAPQAWRITVGTLVGLASGAAVAAAPARAGALAAGLALGPQAPISSAARPSNAARRAARPTGRRAGRIMAPPAQRRSPRPRPLEGRGPRASSREAPDYSIGPARQQRPPAATPRGPRVRDSASQRRSATAELAHLVGTGVEARPQVRELLLLIAQAIGETHDHLDAG